MVNKIVVAVIVFDRFDNIREWVRCFNMCQTLDAQLVVVHNYENIDARDAYAQFCAEMGVSYVPRENIGYDIGAFQDVCRGRLDGFPEFDYLLWCTDDVLPMRKDFVAQYFDKMLPDVGVVAMEISPEVRLHIRTTAFMIRKSVAKRLEFHADPISTKQQCYMFEHRAADGTFLDQVNKMKLLSVQVEGHLGQSPFWDMGHSKKDRQSEHYLMFPKPEQSAKKVAIICPIFNNEFPDIITSILNQTHDNWHLFLVHDGPAKYKIRYPADERVSYEETINRGGNWGHYIRRDWIDRLAGSDFDYIVITNADNYHAPVYLEYMIRGFKNGEVAVFHSEMVHSYTGWGIIKCKPKQGYLDCAGVMIRKDVACAVRWKDVTSHSADWNFFQDIINAHGVDKFGKVEGCLLMHN